MNPEVNSENIGEQLGMEGIGSIVSNAEAYCACEERRIALTNEAKIVMLQAEGKLLLAEDKSICERLKLEPFAGDLKSRKRKTAYYLTVTILLTIAGFVFTAYALEPFRFGLKAYLYAAGVAIVVPFLVDFTLGRWRAEAAIKCLAAVACVAGLVSLILLAAIRGDVMAEGLKNSTPVVTFDDADPQPAPMQNNFYEKTIPLLQLVMILLAMSMELGAGLAMHEVWRLSSEEKENWSQLRKQLKEIHERMGIAASRGHGSKQRARNLLRDILEELPPGNAHVYRA